MAPPKFTSSGCEKVLAETVALNCVHRLVVTVAPPARGARSGMASRSRIIFFAIVIIHFPFEYSRRRQGAQSPSVRQESAGGKLHKYVVPVISGLLSHFRAGHRPAPEGR